MPALPEAQPLVRSRPSGISASDAGGIVLLTHSARWPCSALLAASLHRQTPGQIILACVETSMGCRDLQALPPAQPTRPPSLARLCVMRMAVRAQARGVPRGGGHSARHPRRAARALHERQPGWGGAAAGASGEPRGAQALARAADAARGREGRRAAAPSWLLPLWRAAQVCSWRYRSPVL